MFEWVRARDLRLADDAFHVSSVGRPITEFDFLPRRLMGEYLSWCADRLLVLAPPWLRITTYRDAAVDVAVGDRHVVHLSCGNEIEADYVFLTVGAFPAPHKHRKPVPRLIDQPYPLPERLAEVGAGEVVAIAGLGLTMVDAVLALTIGRGGSFEQAKGGLRYRRSGEEPRILAFSRSGLPYRSRPGFDAPLHYRPVVFTRETIDAHRARQPRLDFDDDVFPLLLTEMRVAYQRARHGARCGWGVADEVPEALRSAAARGTLEASLLAMETDGADAFDSRKAYFGRAEDEWNLALACTRSYQSWFLGWLEADLIEAEAGVATSASKAALESCREFRDIIRHAVDYGGLTDPSLEQFYRVHAPALNRIVIGPQKERTAEMVALIKEGLLSIPLGPDPQVEWDDMRSVWRLRSTQLAQTREETADWFYRGTIRREHDHEQYSSLIGALARHGLVRRFRPATPIIRALDVDQANHPVARPGRIDPKIWLLGPLAEGAVFYNGFLPSPGKFDRSAYDADRAVGTIFAELARREVCAIQA